MADEDSSGDWTGPLTKRDLGMLNKSILTMKEEFSTLLKTELASFRTEIAADISNVRETTNQLTTRLDTTEHAMEEVAATTSSVQEEVKDMRNSIDLLQLKCEDLENRSRRYNLRIKALKETAEGEDLQHCILELFSMFCEPELLRDLKFDLIHRVGLKERQKDEYPRDILVKPQDYLRKEQILQAARKQFSWKFRESEVQVFQDISPATLARRRALKPLTTTLQEKKVRYRWLHPFGLLCEGTTIRSEEEGKRFLWTTYGVEWPEMPEGRQRIPRQGALLRGQRRRSRPRDRMNMEHRDVV